MERLNDYRDNVRAPNCTVTNDAQKLNCAWLTVMSDGEPFQLVVATKPVRHPAWLTIDYGDDYWLSAYPSDTAADVTSLSNPLTFRCSVPTCSARDVVRANCIRCHLNFCVPHRFPTYHKCTGDVPPPSSVSSDHPLLALMYPVVAAATAAAVLTP